MEPTSSPPRERRKQPGEVSAPELTEDIAKRFRWFNELAQGVIAAGEDGRIVYTNEAADRMFRYAAGQLIGKGVAELAAYPQEAAAERVRAAEERASAAAKSDQECLCRREDGTVFYSHSRLIVMEEAGRSYRILVIQDVTKRKIAEAANHYLAAIVDSSDDAIISEDLDGLVMSWNPAAEKCLGYSADEMIGRPISMLAPPEKREEMAATLQRVRGGERIHHYETIWQRKDGVKADISVTISPIRDLAGTIIGTSNIARDITEKRRSEELQRRLAAVVEFSDDAVISKDLNGVIRSWNRGAERMFGYTAEEAVGRQISMLAAGDRTSEMPRILERLRRGELIDHYETRRRRKDGQEITVELTISPILDSQGRVVGASKIARDITERERMRGQAMHLAAIVESSEDAIISKDLQGRIISWNKGAERMFGYTAEEMVGQPVSVLAAPDRINELPTILDRIRRGERIEHYETVRRHKNGALLTVSLAVSPIRSAAGEIIGASKIARNITEQKRAEEALKRANEALRRANAELEQFAYAAAHDLQEPLRMISLFSQMLEKKYEGKLDAQAQDYIRYSVEGAMRMQNLVRDLLAFTESAHLNEGDVPLVDSTAVLAQTLEMLGTVLDQSGAVVTFDPLPQVRMGEVHLKQIFQNLLSNAVKYRGEKSPRIHVSAARDGADWVFSVADNGIGIPPKYQQYIFGIFRRLHNASEYSGTGIGLAICKRTVERYGGRIWVESTPGEGATFYFTVPVSGGSSGDSSR